MDQFKPPAVLVELFDGFAVVRADGLPFQEEQLAHYLIEARKLVTSGCRLLFFDFGKAQNMSAGMLHALDVEVAEFKSNHKVEVVLLSEPGLTAQLKASPLAKSSVFFERLDEHARRVSTGRALNETRNQLQTRLEATLDGAIQVGLQRWIGQKPMSIAEAQVNVNPTTDVVSVVDMTVDGCLFQVYLAGTKTTLHGMVEEILRAPVHEEHLVADGASELLNYLTAFFKQHLTGSDSVVETEAPRLLEADEVLAFLNLDLPAQRVTTKHGTFDVWMGIAA